MKTTIFGVLLDVTPDQDTVLRRLMRKYGSMLRFAFQRLIGGLQNIGGLERHCANETELPLRYAKDAVQEAQDLIRAPAIKPCKTDSLYGHSAPKRRANS